MVSIYGLNQKHFGSPSRLFKFIGGILALFYVILFYHKKDVNREYDSGCPFSWIAEPMFLMFLNILI